MVGSISSRLFYSGAILKLFMVHPIHTNEVLSAKAQWDPDVSNHMFGVPLLLFPLISMLSVHFGSDEGFHF